MKGPTIRSSDGLATDKRRERVGAIVVAGLVVAVVGAYLALNAVRDDRDADRGLLPYQALARTLGASDGARFLALRQGLLVAEAERARTSRWPDVSVLAGGGAAPFAPDGANPGAYRWERFAEGVTVNYLGRPSDPSHPAWLLTVREPEPGALPDLAPNDEQHHRLPDGTALHINVWQHRYGGQVEAAFVVQPQHAGWIEILADPPIPVPSRR